MHLNPLQGQYGYTPLYLQLPYFAPFSANPNTYFLRLPQNQFPQFGRPISYFPQIIPYIQDPSRVLPTSQQTQPQTNPTSGPIVEPNLNQKVNNCKQEAQQEQGQSSECLASTGALTMATNMSQNGNRNLIPCMVQQLLAFINRQSKCRAVLKRIFLQVGESHGVTVRGYFLFMKELKSKQNHYVNQKSLEVLSPRWRHSSVIFSEQEVQVYLRMARCLVRYFLEVRCVSQIYYSKRAHRGKKLEQLHVRRLLIRVMSELNGCK